ncbi:heterokaryon incompatibility protein-domain-containing protein [Nemania serpens]|nr:heterokaryon incompatibility protein-domain-containing protein [Nemania serpens]
MRLIHTTTLHFYEFEQRSSLVPPYAILSHTWGDEEVTFRDMSPGPWHSNNSAQKKKGYAKITQTCYLARQQNLEYAWIDTCCIDESSSAELDESIISMFEWYAGSAACYVFLSDYVPGQVDLEACRWWTRGWTLQELLAPRELAFYDSAWNAVGTKRSLLSQICTITKIEHGVLLDKGAIPNFSVAKRMSWAASRQTTRLEDEACCLLGIFRINLPLIYGEGRRPFRRLQEEIIKRSTDLTIFSWGTSTIDMRRPQFMGLFAESPHVFRKVLRYTGTFHSPEFSLTNRGFLFSDVSPLAEVDIPNVECSKYYGFVVGTDTHQDLRVIILRKVAPGVFCRSGRFQTEPLRGILSPRESTQTRFRIIADLDMPSLRLSIIYCRKDALHVPHDRRFQLSNASPGYLWDATERIFLNPPRSANTTEEPWVNIMEFKTRRGSVDVKIVIISLYESRVPPMVFEKERHEQAAKTLFSMDPEGPITLSDVEKLIPDIASFSDWTDIQLPDNERVTIRASIKLREVRDLTWRAVVARQLYLVASD